MIDCKKLILCQEDMLHIKELPAVAEQLHTFLDRKVV